MIFATQEYVEKERCKFDQVLKVHETRMSANVEKDLGELDQVLKFQETRIACLEERIRQLMKDLAQRDSELRQLLGQKKDEVSHEEQCAEMEARTGGQIGAAGRAGGRDREDC